MSNIPIVYQYQENNDIYNISFLNENNHQMINATEMAKPFNVNIGDFLRDPKRFEMIYKLCVRNSLTISDMNIPTSLNISQLAIIFPESIRVVKGGVKKQGTWFHEDIALEFARWLSVDFAIWCNDKIKELIRQGFVYLVTTKPDKVHEHLNHSTQKKNSKAIAGKNYGSDKNVKRIQNYYRELSMKLIGAYPKQIKSWARKNDIPLSVINAGSREILRYMSSSATACMSLVDNIISSNPDMTSENIDELLPYVENLEPFFAKMIEMGHYDHDELLKIKRYDKMKSNEKYFKK
jgi:hypothetical protein